MLDIPSGKRGLDFLSANQPLAALGLLKQAVRDGQSSPLILLGIAIATEQTGGEARELFAVLPQMFPDWDEAALRWGDFLHRHGDTESALAAYRQALDLNQNRIEALLGLGKLLISTSRAHEAQIPLLRLCDLAPGSAEAWETLGLAFAATKDFTLATTAFSKALCCAPDQYEYAMHRVEAAWRSGRTDAELALIEQESAQSPLDSVLLCARGFLLGLAGRLAEAADSLEAAHLLAPDAHQPASQLAVTLMRMDRNQEAVPYLRRLYRQFPDSVRVANDLAVALMRSHWHSEAAAILQHCLEHQPWHTDTACNLVIVLLWQGQQAEAVALARRAIAADPHNPHPKRVLCNVLPYAEGETGASVLIAAKDCAASLHHPSAIPFATVKDPERPLRIGLLSNLLRTHPVGWLTVAGFESLDPAQFQITVFGRDAGDLIARRIGSIARDWVSIDDLNDGDAAKAIRDREIDILIDLGGWGDHGRLQICASRPAPVQMKWVGMQNHSTGLAEIDWMISDRWETPPELASLYSEKPLILPDGYICYSPPAYAPDVGPLPAIAARHITFGCFNNLAKITNSAIAVWSRILQKMPDAQIIFKTHQFSEPSSRALIHDKFAVYQIDAARIILEGRSPHREFLDAYNKIDIALDPFPYSGGLGTCEALWMGVPTVTLPGDTFASRHSLSHLCNVGLDDWVARDEEHYVALAIEKAGNIESLAQTRASLRARTKSSPLCDAPRFGQSLGKNLRNAWREYCR